MDWFNTHFYHDYAYAVVYPQIYPHHKRPSDEVQQGTIEWGKEKTKKWLTVLNDNWLGKGNKYLTGDEITIADYLRRGAAHQRPRDPRRVQGLSEHRALARSEIEEARELDEGERGDGGLPRGGEGPAIRQRPRVSRRGHCCLQR